MRKESPKKSPDANRIAMALLGTSKKDFKTSNPLKALMTDVKHHKRQTKESVLTKKVEEEEDVIYKTRFDKSKFK